MPATYRLDLPAIERALREVQSRFIQFSQHFTEPRDPLADEVLNNVLEGYALVDEYVARGVELFDLKQVYLMLEINATVLCGPDPARRLEYAQHLAATEAHFFNNIEGASRICTTCIVPITATRSGSAQQASMYAFSANRSGALIVSYLLMCAGLPPFVLTLENAEGYFNPSSVIRNSAKHGVKALYELPKIRKKVRSVFRRAGTRPHEVFSQRPVFTALPRWPLMNGSAHDIRSPVRMYLPDSLPGSAAVRDLWAGTPAGPVKYSRCRRSGARGSSADCVRWRSGAARRRVL